MKVESKEEKSSETRMGRVPHVTDVVCEHSDSHVSLVEIVILAPNEALAAENGLCGWE